MLKLLIIAILGNVTLIAQTSTFAPLDAKSLGMGGSGTACSANILSIGRNPALLSSAAQDSTVYILFPSISFSASTNSISFDNFNKYFGSKNSVYLADEDKEILYRNFSDDGQFYFNFNYALYGLSWTPNEETGTFSLLISDNYRAYLRIPKDLTALLLYGNEQNTTYTFDNFSFNSEILRTYAFSYSKIIYSNQGGKISKIRGGVTAKFINGYAETSVDEMRASLYTGSENKIEGSLEFSALSCFSRNFGINYDFQSEGRSSEFSFFPKPSGYGYGIDYGLSAETADGLIIAFSMTDIGAVHWHDNAASHKYSADVELIDLLDAEHTDSLFDSLKEEGNFISGYETALPTAMRLGMAYEISDNLNNKFIVAFDYHQGLLNDNYFSQKPRFSLGLEFHSSNEAIPLILSGLSNDRMDIIRWSFGIGYSLKQFEVLLSTNDIISLIRSNYNTPNISAGLTVLWILDYR